MEKHMFWVFVLFASCANIVPPDGGPKDITPPIVINSTPENPSIYFKNNVITLVFNEYIQVKNIKDIRISPQCNPPPEIILKGKRLEIKLNCSLEKNTTYTINFGKSIEDLNEGNVLTNFKYVFSRGSSLDSLFIHGTVKDLYFNENLEGVLVGLSNTMDSLIPYYYTYSNRDGSFSLNNIKDDKYLLFSFLDDNNNFQYDLGELVSTPDTVQNLNITKSLGLFYEKPANPIIDVKNINKNTILFEHNILKDSIIILNTPGFWKINLKSSVFWFNKSPNFIKYRYLNITDSIAVSSPDSAERISLKVISELHQINAERMINIETNMPIKNLIPENFTWEISPEAIKPKIINPFIIQIPIGPDFNKSQKLIISEEALVSQNNQTNDSTTFYIESNYEKYGSLKIKSEIADTNLVLELFDNNNIIRKSSLKDSILINWIPPGNYNLRLFSDYNNNMHWDSGSLVNSQACEKIIIYPQTIKIKSNWEVDIILD
ncbi:MAG: hypothetical protein CMP56_01360 [Flavobacteriales bacterium]|nr:hypothetical protein [Flavobacteriales bacterium]|tara:strand:- start:350 stop:1819 length:1470 start_codon:yes stop_codon:yes gene_type:complete